VSPPEKMVITIFCYICHVDRTYVFFYIHICKLFYIYSMSHLSADIYINIYFFLKKSHIYISGWRKLSFGFAFRFIFVMDDILRFLVKFSILGEDFRFLLKVLIMANILNIFVKFSIFGQAFDHFLPEVEFRLQKSI